MHILELNASEHKIESLTVFRAGNAEVVRTFDVSLQCGDYDIEIIGLAKYVAPDSVRASVLNGEARLLDFVHPVRSRNRSRQSQESDAMRALQVRKQMLEAEKRIRQQEGDIHLTYCQTLSSSSPPTDDLRESLQTFVDVRKGILHAIYDLDEQIYDVTKLINDQSEKESTAKQVDGQVKLYLSVGEECNVKLKLTYVVLDAVWEPIYDLHANISEEGKPPSRIMLHYLARITQASGEDWRGANLILSTATQHKQHIENLKLPIYHLKYKSSAPSRALAQQSQPSLLGRAVSLSRRALTWASSFGRTLSQFTVSSTIGLTRSTQRDDALTITSDDRLSFTSSDCITFTSEDVLAYTTNNDLALASDDATIVRSSPLTTSYTLEGAFSVSSDGAAHTVSIVNLDLEALVTRVCVPRMNAEVMLQCTVQNTSDYRFLPGPVSIFLNDSFVTKTTLEEVVPKDHFECALGTDPSMRIRYKLSRVTSSGSRSMLGATVRTVTCTAETIVGNKNGFAISDLVVRDVLPIASEDTIKVELKKPEKLADTQGDKLIEVDDMTKVRWSKEADGRGGESEGKYEWLVTVGAGETVTLRAEWEIKIPEPAWYEEVPDNF